MRPAPRRAVALALLLGGCPVHLARNAPGHIEPLTPPRAPSRGAEGEPSAAAAGRLALEEPGDPGEHALAVTLGPLGGVGGSFDGDLCLAAEAGVELGLHHGEWARSHEKPDFFVDGFPAERVGGNLGILFVDEDGPRLGRLYAEVGAAGRMSGWAVGYGVDLGTAAHGPHVTYFLSTMYLRASVTTGDGLALVWGGFLKLPVTFVWSR